ncbi:DUF6680 family protein [Marinicauda salina]|uniref:DUF6680 family protein n=1 Tax=Marinicauda salina TaxID=2135793 RepID=UPI0011B1FE73|nr:DUF6680 family protein [Marinicauda salina]
MEAETANLILALSAAVAAVIGPTVAVVISLIWEGQRRDRERRENVLQTLLATRGRHADPGFSWAIRTIPVYFNRNAQVMNAHKEFLNAARFKPSEEVKDQAEDETARRQGILISEILKDLGYKGLTSEQIEDYTSEGLYLQDIRMANALDALPHIAISAKRSADASEVMARTIVSTDPEGSSEE